jgi:hypothetical protein
VTRVPRDGNIFGETIVHTQTNRAWSARDIIIKPAPVVAPSVRDQSFTCLS